MSIGVSVQSQNLWAIQKTQVCQPKTVICDAINYSVVKYQKLHNKYFYEGKINQEGILIHTKETFEPIKNQTTIEINHSIESVFQCDEQIMFDNGKEYNFYFVTAKPVDGLSATPKQLEFIRKMMSGKRMSFSFRTTEPKL
jgi:hypothetical protein